MLAQTLFLTLTLVFIAAAIWSFTEMFILTLPNVGPNERVGGDAEYSSSVLERYHIILQ